MPKVDKLERLVCMISSSNNEVERLFPKFECTRLDERLDKNVSSEKNGAEMVLWYSLSTGPNRCVLKNQIRKTNCENGGCSMCARHQEKGVTSFKH